MADYIKYDKDGLILNKYYSVDGSNLTGNILKVDRETFKSITRYHKVKDERIVEMTQAEKDALDAPIVAEQERINALRASIRTKLKDLHFTDEEVDYIISSGV